jgi:tetratricopeptide (TPR) repeat protein
MAFANMARAYGMSRQRDKAIEAARKAAVLDQANFGEVEKQVVSVCGFEEGKEWLEKKEFAKAIEAFTASAQADPSIAETHVGLALAYGNQRKYPEALKHIQEALRLKPGEAGFLDIEKTLKHNAGVTTK